MYANDYLITSINHWTKCCSSKVKCNIYGFGILISKKRISAAFLLHFILYNKPGLCQKSVTQSTKLLRVDAAKMRFQNNYFFGALKTNAFKDINCPSISDKTNDSFEYSEYLN